MPASSPGDHSRVTKSGKLTLQWFLACQGCRCMDATQSIAFLRRNEGDGELPSRAPMPGMEASAGTPEDADDQGVGRQEQELVGHAHAQVVFVRAGICCVLQLKVCLHGGHLAHSLRGRQHSATGAQGATHTFNRLATQLLPELRSEYIQKLVTLGRMLFSTCCFPSPDRACANVAKVGLVSALSPISLATQGMLTSTHVVVPS